MSAANFDEALRRLLVHEGGYGNHPSDPGGPTKYGITIRDVRKYLKPAATAEDVRALSLADAKSIYRSKYWNAMRCDELPSGVDYAVFDYGVNSGVARAAKVLRQVAGVPRGKGFDAALVARVRERDAQEIIRAICDERLAFLQRLRTWPIFGRGWGRRVVEVRSAALSMAKSAHGRIASQTAASTQGKASAPASRTVQTGTAAAVAATGGLFTYAATSIGAHSVLIGALLLLTGLGVLAAWFLTRARHGTSRRPDAITEPVPVDPSHRRQIANLADASAHHLNQPTS